MHQNYNSWFWNLRLMSALAIAGAITFFSTSNVLAQSKIVPDNTLGSESSSVTPNYPNTSIPTEVIEGGAVRGNNLFHSFEEFNVSEGRAAFFQTPNNIQNIIARVTGANRSEILGTLGTEFISGKKAVSNANLFLINPNGIIFGPKAKMFLGGSFVASSASGIKFDDGTLFSVAFPTSLLTVSVPVGLQIGRNVGNIQVQGSLGVAPSKTLALVGGNITLDGGKLTAVSGQVTLGGILEAGIIGLNLDNRDLPLSFPDNTARADVLLSNEAIVDVSDDMRNQGGGTIQLRGREVRLNNASAIAANITGSQNGRDSSIQASKLIIQDGSQVSASTKGKGSGGSLTVSASDLVQLIGTAMDTPSGLFVRTDGEGPAGDLTIKTGKLIVQNGANISVSTDKQGRGGTLNVTASDLIELSGTSTLTQKPSGLFTQTLGSGDAGNLTINTKQLIVKDGAVATAGTNELSRGKGGDLVVNASDSIKLSGTPPNSSNSSGLFARTRGSGTAGSLVINTGKLIVQDKAQVTVESLGTGGAGGLTINANSILLNRGELKASTKVGSGGNIELQDLNLLLMQNNSLISAKAFNTANGGNIKIDSDLIVAVPSENSDILANASRGNGGSISIKASGIFGLKYRDPPTDTTSDINASSQFGVDGVVEINTPVLNPSQGLIELQAAPVDVSKLIAQGCPASVGTRASKFVITGRGGLPDNPSDTLSSDAVWLDLVTLPTQENRSNPHVSNHPTNTTPTPLVEAQGWITGKNGEVILTATAPTTTPDIPWLNPADCHPN